jgi:hypothetical protein
MAIAEKAEIPRAVQRSFLARMGRVSLKCHTPMGTAL